MKHSIFCGIVLLFIGLTGTFAQQFENESELYPKTLSVDRIYRHAKGFRIDYIRQDYSRGVFWAPIEWFRAASGLGELVSGKGAHYPYVTFFYKGGEIDSFRLYAPENPSHLSWGTLDPYTDYESKFPPPDSRPQISF